MWREFVSFFTYNNYIMVPAFTGGHVRSFHSVLRCFSVVLLAGMSQHSIVFGQSTELLRQQLMNQGAQNAQPVGEVPGLQSSRSVIRVSDTMPDGVEQVLPPQSDILLDGTIDPDKYIVGPGDLFGVYLWGTIEKNYRIRVSPEGYLIVPTIGSLKIAGLSITDAADVFKRSLDGKYNKLDISIFLMEPRKFRLSVTGMVYVPGMHGSHALERVSDVLERAGIIYPGALNIDETSPGQQISVSAPQGASVSVSTEDGGGKIRTR